MTYITLPHDRRPRRLGATIVAWFQRIEAGKSHWTQDGLVDDLMLMSGCVWTGERRASPGGTPYTYPKSMDRLETLQAQYPCLTFFVGTFPQVKGQDRTQILWYSDTDLGAEADLPGISAHTNAAQSRTPPGE